MMEKINELFYQVHKSIEDFNSSRTPVEHEECFMFCVDREGTVYSEKITVPRYFCKRMLGYMVSHIGDMLMCVEAYAIKDNGSRVYTAKGIDLDELYEFTGIKMTLFDWFDARNNSMRDTFLNRESYGMPVIFYDVNGERRSFNAFSVGSTVYDGVEI